MDLSKEIVEKLKTYDDFPIQGIKFYDMHQLMAKPEIIDNLVGQMMDTITQQLDHVCFHGVVSPESRGFLFGPTLAYMLGLPFIPVRKEGKMPGMLIYDDYNKEYGKDRLSLNPALIEPHHNYLIVDDVLATGGTVLSCARLIEKAGAVSPTAICVLKIKALMGSHALEERGIASKNMVEL